MKNNDKLIREEHYITSPFGYRVHPVTKKTEGHNGVDYGTNNKKVPCYAVDDGTVLKVGKDRYSANFVYVKFHLQGKIGLYYHLDSVSVKVGQKVTPETIIGAVGNTGRSTGIHLHFSWIEDNDKALKYYEADYIDFENYTFTDDKLEQAKKILKDKVGLSDGTIQYLADYKYGKDLILKLADKIK